MINGLEKIDDEVIVYHAGTKREENKILTNGGRVLGVTSVIKNQNLKLAQQKAYEAINKISFDGMNYRKDIAEKAFKHLK